MGMKNYGRDTGEDRHANQRDRKKAARERDARMRGNRSVFEIEKAIAKRGREAREKRA